MAKFERIPDPAVQPVDTATADRALATFITNFVQQRRQERARFLLGEQGRRGELMQKLPDWVERTRAVSLEGEAGFPQALQDRFGELRGVLVRAKSAVSISIAAAISEASDSAIFVADRGHGHVGLAFYELGAPALCQR